MQKVTNSNCKKCPSYINLKCSGDDSNCICRFCPRNMEMCIITKWCRETESSIYFEQ